MHSISISPKALARAAERPPSSKVLPGMVPARTAHVVVDLQNGFMAPGAPVEVPEARGIVGAVNRISSAMRAAGGTNVFLRMNLGTPATESWRSYLDHFPSAGKRQEVVDAFRPGSEHFRLWEGLDVEDRDLVVDKVRFSAFVPGASSLHEELSARDVDTLVITGTLTNVCCESTARDAMQMGYRIAFVSDATAALTDELHNSTLENMMTHFADVVTAGEVVGALAGQPVPARS